MPKLVAPTVRLHKTWLAALGEWGPGNHEDGFGPHMEHDVETPDGFIDWVQHLHQWADLSDQTIPSTTGRVHATHWWIVEGDTVLGGIALRHDLGSSPAQEHGHIGYGIRPSARDRGVATWALGQVLIKARDHGFHRVLVTCAEGNLASARVIERNGGVLEGVRDSEYGRLRRYWIALPL